MEKSYTSIVGIPVAADGYGKLTRVTDILVDTENGNVAAFYVSSGKNMIVAPIDIHNFGHAVLIGDPEDIIDAEELVKVQEIRKRDIELLKCKVETKKGEYLGNVHDYTIDTKALVLTKILVYKSFLGLFKTPGRLIPASDIVKITKGLVVVKNKYSLKYQESKTRKYRDLNPDPAA